MKTTKRNEDFYQKLRRKMPEWKATKDGKKHKFSEYILVAPDLFHLLCKLSIDPAVPMKEKAKIVGAIAYFVSPVDLIPELVVGPIGYTDDIVVAAYALNSIINNVDEELINKHWVGKQDILVLVKDILKISNELVGGAKNIKKLTNFLK